MATRVVMAQLSPTMEEGKLIEWKFSEGDEIRPGDIVAEIETDKANMDVEALGGGVLRKILVGPGAVAPVGALIGIIADPEEDIGDLLTEAEGSGGGPAAASEPTRAREKPVPAAGPAADRAPAPHPVAAEGEEVKEGEPAAAPVSVATEREEGGRTGVSEGDGRLRASPVARRMARERGIELAAVAGSGPAGRIVKRDVEAAIRATAEAPTAAAVPAAPSAGVIPVPAAGQPGAQRLEEQVIEHSQMRKTIARRLAESIGPVPHFFLTMEIAMDTVLDLRAELNARSAEGKIGVNDLLVKAVAEALVRHPAVNASWEDDAIRRHGRVDIGIAVALEDGLITPVIRNADRKGLYQIARESVDLIARARARKLTPDEYTGATFTISNLGMFDIDEFTAVINPPEAAILAVGRTVEKPVVEDGEVVVRRRMRVTMSNDHRLIDGAVGARFLGTFRAMLENPLVMLL